MASALRTGLCLRRPVGSARARPPRAVAAPRAPRPADARAQCKRRRCVRTVSASDVAGAGRSVPYSWAFARPRCSELHGTERPRARAQAHRRPAAAADRPEPPQPRARAMPAAAQQTPLAFFQRLAVLVALMCREGEGLQQGGTKAVSEYVSQEQPSSHTVIRCARLGARIRRLSARVNIWWPHAWAIARDRGQTPLSFRVSGCPIPASVWALVVTSGELSRLGWASD